MKKIEVESEGVTILIKEDEISDNHISFRIEEEGEILPYFFSASREAPRVVRLFVQYPPSETSRKIYLDRGLLINLIDQIVSESLDLVSENNLF